MQGLRRWATEAWPLLQGTAAATVAWLIAKWIGDHPDPFFAPIAAVIALNAPPGERGLNALRLLQGVVIGIVAGELAVGTLGGGYGTLALATFVAMAVASALGGARLVIAQAAVGAVLTVASADGQIGPDRLIDALVGACVALVFSQLLFAPEPVRLLRRAEAAALEDMAGGLGLTAEALEQDDAEKADRGLGKLRDMRDRLADLGRVRDVSTRVARRSATWRSQARPVVKENENAGHLDLLGASCLTLARTAATVRPEERRELTLLLRELAAVLAALAHRPGDQAVRQAATDRALDAARRIGDGPAESDALAAGLIAARTVIADVMVFAGIDADDAHDAVEAGTGEFTVPTPPPAPRTPFKTPRRRPAG
jgi:uncharacterized membrane protein YgaE (UPF0421/DUF939 family)